MMDHVAIIELCSIKDYNYKQKDAHIYSFPILDRDEILFTIKDLEKHYEEVYISYNGNIIRTTDLIQLGLESFCSYGFVKKYCQEL